MTLGMPATLAAVAASGGGSPVASLLIFALPVLLILFMVFSQRRRQREVQSLQAALVVGDEVCTTSGLYGTIASLDDSTATLEISPGVTVRFDRRAIGTKTVPTGPVAPGTTE
ncbi:preprotein translocase subunit YajC [Phycicoccus badiiscoriae]|uniref:Preprotein translocase subunit YajC n=1 Tax=Pedococcus badiiscoriae TaxID=642776 RepID=A0A852WIJ4_9MICO|nr:preprotein translocase subunit YajC [Pedococcus badiiscoriae]NYG08579.1 preprotein translocase subunit YajC [Pedococcus badiiscoriae]